MSFETISVVGLGYIGLPTAAVIASRRKTVFGLDINQNTVDIINRGKIHIVEPELDMLVHAAVTKGYLIASTVAKESDAFLIAVPTPFKRNYEPDLKYVESAVKLIAPVLQKGNLIILESTSPVGTTEKMASWLAELRPDLSFPQTHGENSDIRLAHCPERVLPGHIVRELVENDRVIGGMTTKCSDAACDLYNIFVTGKCISTTARTAEMVKLAENSFRDVNIAFANELSVICDKHNISVWELIKLANRHPRVNILQPGPGVGGHCIAVDPWFIVSQSPDESRLIKMARDVNDDKPYWVVSKVKKAVNLFLRNNPGCTVNDIKIACFGLSFKPNIDDLRESPAVLVAKKLASSYKGQILLVEPNIAEFPAGFPNAWEFVDMYEAIDIANVIVLLVDHKEFYRLKLDKFDKRYLVDTRGVWHEG